MLESSKNKWRTIDLTSLLPSDYKKEQKLNVIELQYLKRHEIMKL